MDRRQFLRNTFASTLALGAPALPGKSFQLLADSLPVSRRAIQLVRGTTVVDMLGLLTFDWELLRRWQRQPGSLQTSAVEKIRRTGIDVFHPAVDPNHPQARRAAVRILDDWDRFLDSYPGSFAPVLGVADLDAARASGRTGILLGFQNSRHFQSVEDVELFYRRGQRVSQLTYDQPNELGTGCRASRDEGLSRFGVEVVAAMNELGMAIDVSHCSDRTCLEVFEASSQPVLITHSNSRTLVPGHPRCKPDDVLRAMARSGGVIGITAVRAFVHQPRATLKDLLDHFDHVARVVGPRHVGLGSDLDVDARDPRTNRIRAPYRIDGFEPAQRAYLIADGLLQRGWSEEDVRGILGGNFRRVLGEIWTT